MNEIADLFKLTIALLAIVDPIAGIPMFLSATAGNSSDSRQRTAQVVAITVFCVLGVSALIGTEILRFFGISIPSFLIGGGILLLLLAISMLQAQDSRIRQTPDEVEEQFQQTGTIHLFATAGLHVGIVAFLAGLASRP